MALRPVLVDTKDKHLSANWGKQWGKHYAHFDTFVCIGLLCKIAEGIDFNAFKSKAKKCEAIKLDPSGPRKLKSKLHKNAQIKLNSERFAYVNVPNHSSTHKIQVSIF